MKAEEIQREFGAGDCIVEPGAESRELYVVCSGNVLVHCESPGVDYVLGPGDFFGETSALLSRPQPHRVVAEDDVQVLVLTPEMIESLARGCPEFNVRLIRALAERSVRPGGEAVQPEEVTPAQRAMARVILARKVAGEGPASVQGKLRELAEAAKLDIRDAYQCLQGMLDRRLVGLVDDQLTVLEGDELEAMTRL